MKKCLNFFSSLINSLFILFKTYKNDDEKFFGNFSEKDFEKFSKMDFKKLNKKNDKKKNFEKFSNYFSRKEFEKITEKGFEKFSEYFLKKDFHNFFSFCSPFNNYLQNVLLNFDQGDNEYLENDKFFLKMDDFDILLKKKILNPVWLNSIKISNFTKIEYMDFYKINQTITITDISNEIFLSLLIMIFSSILFLISTEIQFIQIEERKIIRNKTGKIKYLYKTNSLENLKKTKKYHFSKKLHSKAITILHNYFFDNHLTNHLVKSFQENYKIKQDLEKIVI